MNSYLYHILVNIAVALLCAGCTASTPVKRNAESDSRAAIYQTDSQKKSPAATFNGQVISIEDGDTIVVADDANRSYTVRLQGIDAPEAGQSFGDRSRQNLEQTTFARQVEVQWFKRDRYGRIVGKVLSNGSDVCLQQIKTGMAWHYKYFQNEQSARDRELYATAEVEARAERRGLWSGDNPVPPWQFRRTH